MFCYSVRIDTNTLFEIASTSLRSLILERNHVVVLPILFSCQGTDDRERAARLPDPLAPCQAKYLLLREEIAFDSEVRISVEKNVVPRNGYNWKPLTIISNLCCWRTKCRLGPTLTPIPRVLFHTNLTNYWAEDA